MASQKGKQIRHGLRVAREFALHASGIRRPAEKRFVILSRARSGSTALASLLNSVPNVHCDGEILRRPLPFPERYIHARSAAKRCEAYGFKMLMNHVREVQRFADPENLVQRLHSAGFTIIHLRRNDQLASAISIIRALRFGFHERKARPGNPSREPLRIEYSELVGRLERIDDHERYAQRLLHGVPHVEVNYEADLADAANHQATVDRLCAEFGVESGPVKSKFVKLAAGALRDSVLNFDELDAQMRETRWADLFAAHR